jgi:hypothetical protein
MDPNVCNTWLKSDYISRQAIHTMAKEAIHTMAKGAIHTMAKGKRTRMIYKTLYRKLNTNQTKNRRTNSCDPDG